MGGRFSIDLGYNADSSDEITQSLDQIVRAFNQEFHVDAERLKPHHHHHHTHPIASTSSTQPDDFIRPTHHRSNSVDGHSSEEHSRRLKYKSSTLKRQWQCQFCHKINEGDILICSECGSNKINVYIPIMDRESSRGFSSPTVVAR